MWNVLIVLNQVFMTHILHIAQGWLNIRWLVGVRDLCGCVVLKMICNFKDKLMVHMQFQLDER